MKSKIFSIETFAHAISRHGEVGVFKRGDGPDIVQRNQQTDPIMFNRRAFLTAALAAPVTAYFVQPATAAEPQVFSDGGVAIRGADPVAFFTEGAPVIGSPDHALMWNGTTWHFASAQNMETFMADPMAYAPQYGGYCAFAMSKGYVATSVPEAWTIHDGKLYLNYSVNVRQVWSEDIPGNIERADGFWPTALG